MLVQLASKNIVGIASGEIACAAWNDKGELFMWGSNIEQVLVPYFCSSGAMHFIGVSASTVHGGVVCNGAD